jgi:hypothetical protein
MGFTPMTIVLSFSTEDKAKKEFHENAPGYKGDIAFDERDRGKCKRIHDFSQIFEMKNLSSFRKSMILILKLSIYPESGQFKICIFLSFLEKFFDKISKSLKFEKIIQFHCPVI